LKVTPDLDRDLETELLMQISCHYEKEKRKEKEVLSLLKGHEEPVKYKYRSSSG